MSLRKLIEVLVMGLLLIAGIASQNCPYQPSYFEDPAAYHSERPSYPAKSIFPVANAKFLYDADQQGGGYKYSPGGYTAAHCPKVGGLESHCRPAKDCAVWYDLVRKTPGTGCRLENGHGKGICCPDLPLNGRHGKPFSQPGLCQQGYKLDAHVEGINIVAVNEAADAGHLQMSTAKATEKRLFDNNIRVRPGSDRHTHSWLFFHSTNDSVKISNGSMYGVYTAQQLVKRYQIKPEQVHCALNRFFLKDTVISETCPTFPDCDLKTFNSPFRTITGICNNIHPPGHVPWGLPRTQYQRALAPNYSDGLWMPRRAKNGGDLPPPRVISLSVVRDIDAPSDTDTTWMMQFAQFVDHDVLETVEAKLADGSPVPCCTDDGLFLSEQDYAHGKCIPVEIPKDDPFYSKFRQRCMQFARSAPACRNDRRLGHVEQMNQNTHFLDLSAVYGSSDEVALEVRTFKNGALNVTRLRKDYHYQMDLLPPDDVGPEISTCALSKAVSGIDPPPEVRCFKAGDNRVNVSPYMVVTQTVILREHNRIAEELAELNPHWDDERLYQETRRIIIGQWHHVIYNEFLPALIGRSKMQELGLLPLQHGFSRDYDENVNPSILNEFAGAAFRFGHSLVPGRQDLINQQRIKEKDILLRQHFFKTQEIYPPGNVDKFLIALATVPGQSVDNYFTEELTNHLFEEEGKGFGMDLVSLNIQRGRDHGFNGYNAYRALCGLPVAKEFHDLLDLLSPTVVEKFELLYDSVDDIDLFIAAVSEKKADGALVGPTFSCIIADQFLRLKRGDRYFYDLGGQAGSFTEDQLNEIRKISYARLVCDNSNVLSSQPLIFKSVSEVNPIVDCESSDSIPRMNLYPWKEVENSAWHVAEDGVKWFPDCDFPGYDIGYVQQVADGGQCAQKCKETKGCNAFWASDGWCTLKTIPSWHHRAHLSGGICGFVPEKF